jgi:hypothetical protein
LPTWEDVAAFLKSGVRGLPGRHRQLVAEPQRFRCSLDLDRARSVAEPRAPRWDYVLGTDADCIGLEVHPARASEVAAVIRKKDWAAAHLEARCGLIASRWCWVVPPGARVQLTPVSPHARQLAKSGIQFPARRLL